MFEQILAAVSSANRSQLRQYLSRNPPERHAQMRAGFQQHMANIAGFCLQGYAGAGSLTTAFIRELHRQHFPPGFQLVSDTPQGKEVVIMIPGEYKTLPNHANSYAYPGRISDFVLPADVEVTLAKVVHKLNSTLPLMGSAEARLEAILWFVLDFLDVHPFADANGRIACVLTDVLLIKEGLPPIYFFRNKEEDTPRLYAAVEIAREKRDLKPLYQVIEWFERNTPSILGESEDGARQWHGTTHVI